MSNDPTRMVTSAQLREARDIVARYIKRNGIEEMWRWEGIAPSYLTADMEVSYETAEALILALEAEGLIFDNGMGNKMHTRRKDGSVAHNRFYPAKWLVQMTPEDFAAWKARVAKDVEWERREAECDAANIPPNTGFFNLLSMEEMVLIFNDDIDGYLARKAERIHKHLVPRNDR